MFAAKIVTTSSSASWSRLSTSAILEASREIFSYILLFVIVKKYTIISEILDVSSYFMREVRVYLCLLSSAVLSFNTVVEWSYQEWSVTICSSTLREDPQLGRSTFTKNFRDNCACLFQNPWMMSAIWSYWSHWKTFRLCSCKQCLQLGPFGLEGNCSCGLVRCQEVRDVDDKCELGIWHMEYGPIVKINNIPVPSPSPAKEETRCSLTCQHLEASGM